MTEADGVETMNGDNKRIVTDFYQRAFDGDPAGAVAEHVGDRYVQHNPQAPDGPEAFVGFVEYLRGENPDLQLNIKRVMAEDDLVFTHSELVLRPGAAQALADIFRVENGKVVEHWDVIQDVPTEAANDNGMF